MNFLGMGPMELFLIMVLAMVVFGPGKLPEIMGQMGRMLRDFRRTTRELSDEFNKTLQAELAETRAIITDLQAEMAETKAAVEESMTLTPMPHTIEPTPAPALVSAPGENGSGEVVHEPMLSDAAILGDAPPEIGEAHHAPGDAADSAPTPAAHTNGVATHDVSPPAGTVDTRQSWAWEVTPSEEAAREASAATAVHVPGETESASAAANAEGPSSSESDASSARRAQDEILPPY